MKNEFRGRSLEEVVTKIFANRVPNELVRKNIRREDVSAPPLFWGPWTEIFVQFGVTGPDKEDHVTRVKVSYKTASRTPSSFDVEIKGGDKFVSTTGPGSEVITITGNVATAISVRFKSHSVGQIITVTASA